MLTYQQAQQLILARARSFGSEVIDINHVQGLVLAETVVADRDYPPFNRSAMDGYALMFSDYQKGIRDYQVIETIFAGQFHHATLETAQCYKIMTGAAVPDPADMVVRREDTIEQNNAVVLKAVNSSQYQHISLRGEDLKALDVVISDSRLCNPAVISLMAALGKSAVAVKKQPHIGLFTTGNEVKPIDYPLNPVQIRNSNRYLLTALLKNWNIEPQIIQHIPDDKEQMHSVLEKAMDLDIIILSGGVSAGDADFVPEVMEGLAVKQLFHKVSIKPGKPFWCGELKSGGLVFALPGNPFSCQVTFTLFINPYLHACFGLPEVTMQELPLLNARSKKSILDEFFPVRIHRPQPALETVFFNGSGDIRAGLHADGLAIHPAAIKTLADGAFVNFIPFTFL
ncbi:MAG: molybdopterin molybdotransferase MoeA [Chitinophagaceae bacterium]